MHQSSSAGICLSREIKYVDQIDHYSMGGKARMRRTSRDLPRTRHAVLRGSGQFQMRDQWVDIQRSTSKRASRCTTPKLTPTSGLHLTRTTSLCDPHIARLSFPLQPAATPPCASGLSFHGEPRGTHLWD